MMGTALRLLIFNILFFLVLVSCSSSPNPLKLKVKLKESTERAPIVQKKSDLIERDTNPTLQNTIYFKDVTLQYGLSNIQSVQHYAVDFDGDGYTDIVLFPESYSHPEFYKFYPKEKKYKKIESPFVDGVRGDFLVFLFKKNKNIPDLILGTRPRQTNIRQVALRYFEGIKTSESIKYQEKLNIFPEDLAPVTSLIPLDHNLNGELDFFITTWTENKNGKVVALRDLLLSKENNAYVDKTYLLKGESEFNTDMEIYFNAYPSTSASVCDFNFNHYPDILVTTANGHPNKLWMNQKDSFDNRAWESGFAKNDLGTNNAHSGGFSLYSLCGDYNNDGFMDVLLGEFFHSWEGLTRDHSSVLTGKSHTPEFFRTPYSIENEQTNWTQADKRGVWIDMNNNGLTDFLVENTGFPPATRLIAFKQEDNHEYIDVAREMGIDVLNPSGIVTLDFNRDGKMDILVGSTNERSPSLKTRLFLFENIYNTQDIKKNRAIRFYLRGDEANFHGIGATLKLKTNKRTLTKFVQYSYGPVPSQNEEGIHFGIGHDKLEYLEVLWPIVKNGKPLTKIYPLKKFKFNKFREFTICEDGKIKKAKTNCFK